MNYPTPEQDMPTWEEVFDKPYSPAAPLPPAWVGDSIAVQFADRDCARLIVEACLAPPIRTRREFEKAIAQAGARRVHYAS
jgi:hypothetical protein